MCKPGTTYSPVGLVLISRLRPVSVLVRVIVALGTAAPEESVTVPTIVPSCAKACRERNKANAKSSPVQRKVRLFTQLRLLSTDEDEHFIAAALQWLVSSPMKSIHKDLGKRPFG